MQFSFNANARFFNRPSLLKLPGRFPLSVPLVLLCVLFAAYAVGMSMYCVLMHRNYWTQAFDLGIFDQAMYLAGQFDPLFITIRGLNKFGDHFDPIIILLGQFYRIWNDVSFMLIIHTLVIALGVFPIYFFAKKKIGSEWIALAFSALYFCYPALISITIDVIHPEAFAMTFMLYALYCALEKKYLPFAIFGVLAIFCKEDICITFACIGIYLFFKVNKRVGLWTIAASVVYFIVCMKLVIPYFSGSDFFRFRVGWFSEFYTNRFNPSWYVSTIFKPESIMYLFDLFFPILFICFLDLPLLLIAAPAIGINILSNTGYLRSVEWHYNTGVIPFVFLAAVAGFSKIYKTAQIRVRVPPKLLISSFPRIDFRFNYAIFLILFAGIFTNFVLSKNPYNAIYDQIKSFNFYINQPSEQPMAADRAVQLIPPDAVVSADYTLVPHLAHRKGIYMFPNPFKADNWGVQDENQKDPAIIQYIVVSPQRIGENEAIIDKLVASNTFTLIYHDPRDLVMLYKRN